MKLSNKVMFNVSTNKLVGFTHLSAARDVLCSELTRAAQVQGADSDLPPAETLLAEQMLVFYVDGMGVSGIHHPVARYFLSTVDKAAVRRYFNEVVSALHRVGLVVVSAVDDGTDENRSFMSGLANLPVSQVILLNLLIKNTNQFLGNSVQWGKFDKNFMIARAHPCLGADFPIFLISDMPHLIKKLCNAPWASWLSGNKRNMCRPNDPALNSPMLYAHTHIGMLEEAWIAIEGAVCALGGQPASLRNCRFIAEDFKLNCFNKMLVPAAMRGPVRGGLPPYRSG
ncbi:hypothetical protein T492DRAFT_833491 [Pavlovales sp. CCMP2436]|nr:hypothetical protein T492DRAFT_833491 [Pavlovales sp. CCMP2436]